MGEETRIMLPVYTKNITELNLNNLKSLKKI